VALCCSVAEYCAPVWARFTYTCSVDDAELNSSMWLISGTLRPMRLPCLPVLSHIEPPVLRHRAAVDRRVAKATAHHVVVFFKISNTKVINVMLTYQKVDKMKNK